MKRLLLAILILCAPSFAAIGYVTGGSIVQGGANLVINTTTADLIVVSESDFTGNGFNWGEFNVTANSWTCATLQNTSDTKNQFCWTHPAHVASNHGFFVGSNTSIVVEAYSGTAALSPIDSVGATSTSSPLSPGTITPTCTNMMVVTSVGARAPSNVPSVSGVTLRHSIAFVGTSFANGVGDSIQTSATAVTPSWTIAGSTTMASTAMSFKATDSVCGGTKRRIIVTGGGD